MTTLDDLRPVIGLRDAGGSGISDHRLRLLEAIDRTGSIAAAARAVGLTYKAAWDAVAALNNLAPRPLVVRRVGGRAGGGASLSADGRRLLHMTQRLQDELQRLVRVINRNFDLEQVASTPLWRLPMKTSARNMLLCTVAQVKPGAVNSEVLLDVSPTLQLAVIITDDSVAGLGLAPGSKAYALIKSSFVILARAGEVGRTSARNVIPGTVVRREDGAVNSEIVLDIGEGKSIAAIITKESATSLDFKVGDAACALIKASHIILAVD